MDIYSFLNSRDTAEHCRKIEKVWSPVQMTLIIGHSKRPLEEKHEAWRALISEYPDTSVSSIFEIRNPEEILFSGLDSLHDAIQKRLAYDECIIRKFMDETSAAVYQYCLLNSDYDCRNIFTSLEKALADAEENLVPNVPETIEVRKHLFREGESAGILTVEFDQDRRVLRVKADHSAKICEDTYTEDIHDFFIGMHCTDIPVPFEVGDVLTFPDNSYNEDAFVLAPSGKVKKKWYEEYKKNEIYFKLGFSAYEGINQGYYVDSAGLVYQDEVFELYDAEYFRKPHPDNLRILHHISLYLKGELNLEVLLSKQYYLYLKNKVNEELRYCDGFRSIHPELLAENYPTEERKDELIRARKVMPWLEGKFTFPQVEWLAAEHNMSVKEIQQNILSSPRFYAHRCADIIRDENHYKTTGDSRWNPERMVMAEICRRSAKLCRKETGEF